MHVQDHDNSICRTCGDKDYSSEQANLCVIQKELAKGVCEAEDNIHQVTLQDNHSEMTGQFNLQPLYIRRTNRRLAIFHKIINGHLALSIGNLQPVLRRTRHVNSKASNTIHTSKDCYKYSFFHRTIKTWTHPPTSKVISFFGIFYSAPRNV